MTNSGDPNFSEPNDSTVGANGVPQGADVPPPNDASSQNIPVGSTPVDSTPPGALSNTPAPPPGSPQVNPQYAQQIPGAEKKLAAGLCGILIGSLGIHKFILGYNTEGIIMLSVTLVGIFLSCLFLPILGTTAMWIIGLVEGIMYLTKTDQEFVDTYVTGRKPWF